MTFQIENHDAVLHDVTLIATRVPVDELPTLGIAWTSRALSSPRLLSEPVTLTVSLQPGRYAMVCTVPHHYVRDQMVATLVVS